MPPRAPHSADRPRSAGLAARLSKLLSRADAGRWIMLLSLCLMGASSFAVGRTTDDYFQQLVLTGEDMRIRGADRAALDAYAFTGRDAAQNLELKRAGVLPWYAAPEISIRFWRTLSSATLWLDYQLWPHSAALMHLHSLLWFGLLLWALARLYGELTGPPWAGALALALYAVDDARAPALGWIAGRHTFISLTFAACTLLAHHRARQDGRTALRCVSPVCFVLGLLSGETGVVALAYLLGYALFLDRAPWPQRVRSLAPYAVLLLAWRVAYASLGYGVHHSGLYLDPAADALSFTKATLSRMPVLLVSQLTLPFADVWEGLPMAGAWLQPAVLACALLVLFAMAILLRPLWRASALTRFWLLGTLLSALLACAGMPHDRLVNGLSVGSSALLAQLVAHAVEGTPGLWSFSRKVAVSALAGVHLVLAPLLLPVRMGQVAVLEPVMQRVRTATQAGDLKHRTLVLINPAVDGIGVLLPIYAAAKGWTRPEHYLWLATGLSPLRVTRVDERSLEVAPDGGFVRFSGETLFRSRDTRSHVGDKLRLSAAELEVRRVTEDGRPAVVLARFEHPLEDDRLRFMQWKDQSLVAFVPPAIGESVQLQAVDVVNALL